MKCSEMTGLICTVTSTIPKSFMVACFEYFII